MSKKIKSMNELQALIQKQYPLHAEAIIGKANKMYYVLCNENRNQTEKELSHTRDRIYPVISYYTAFSEVVLDKTKAYQLIEDYFTAYAKNASKQLQGICKIPFVYLLVPKIMSKIIQGTYGFKAGFTLVDKNTKKGECHIDVVGCPYFSNCQKYNCIELATVFCNSDDIAYGAMHPKLVWGRTKTLGRGDACCDFELTIKK